METATIDRKVSPAVSTPTSYGAPADTLTKGQVYSSINLRIENLGVNVRSMTKKAGGKLSAIEALSQEGEILQWLIDSYHSRKSISFFQRNYLSRELLQRTIEVSGAINMESKYADGAHRKSLSRISLN